MDFILIYYETMSIQERLRSPRELTLRERMWIENFHAGETPASLRLADEFVSSLRPESKILDVGCASGRVVNFLATKARASVTGIDINSSEIQYAKGHFSHPGVNFEVMDGTRLEFPDNSFDHVVMLGVIGGVDLETRKRLLREAYYVVKPGGKVAVTEFKMNSDDPDRIKKYEEDSRATGEPGSRIIKKGNKVLFIAKHFTEDELRKLLSDAGFTEIELKEQVTETAGIGDGIIEKRQQYTIWGTKPIIGH